MLHSLSSLFIICYLDETKILYLGVRPIDFENGAALGAAFRTRKIVIEELACWSSG